MTAAERAADLVIAGIERAERVVGMWARRDIVDALMADPALLVDLAIEAGAIKRATAVGTGNLMWFGDGEGEHDPGWTWYVEPDEGVRVWPLYVGTTPHIGTGDPSNERVEVVCEDRASRPTGEDRA